MATNPSTLRTARWPRKGGRLNAPTVAFRVTMWRFVIERARSFGFAFRGIGVMLRSQHNAWLHALATFLVILAGLWFGLDRGEWCWIVLATMSVWTAEALNTALEFLVDVSSPGFHPLAGKAKDVAAGAVLLSAIGSIAIGMLVFIPHILAQFRQ